MPYLQVKTAATIAVKLGAGRIYSIVGVAAGTGFAFQINDGPDTAGNVRTIIGQSAAIPVVAGAQYINQTQPMTFRDGCQVVTSGTPGELGIQYD